MFGWLFARKDPRVETLYGAIVAGARREFFYRDLDVPDTVDGRFEMIVLHLFLVLQTLKDNKLKQSVTDLFFKDMDRSLREMGVGDLTVGKKVRKMAEACYGRLNAYDIALKSTEPSAQLAGALGRNVYAEGAASSAPKLAAWAIAARGDLVVMDQRALAEGKFTWP